MLRYIGVARMGAGGLPLGLCIIGADAQCVPGWNTPSNAAVNGGVGAAAVWNGDVVAWGGFTAAGGLPAPGLARWTGTGWQSFPTGVAGQIRDMVDFEGDLIVAGNITQAGSLPVSHIARWNGEWSGIGTGLGGSFVGVCAVAHSHGILYAGGGFVTAGAQQVNRIARWDGRTWSPLGSGANGVVMELVEFQGDLIAGGLFTEMGGLFTRIARWTGTSWQSMEYFGGQEVSALAVHDDALYAGILGKGVNYVSRWSGDDWEVMVLPVGWAVTSLTSYRGDLVGAGWLDPGFSGQSMIRRLVGSQWSSLGAGISGPGVVFDLASHADVLYAGGTFLSAGGQPTPYWAQWGCACYADCNSSASLTIADYSCFQTQFVLGHSYADCNSDGVLTIADFGCFQAKFVGGCP